MNALRIALNQTLQSFRLIWLIYGITLVLGLVVALPFYNTLKVEDQNSLAVQNLLTGFDYTVFSDFMHRSSRTISPLMSVGRWLGLVYVFLSVFFAGGIFLRFSQPKNVYTSGLFWQGCAHYVSRYLRLFGVTFLFLLVGAGLWLVVGSLISVAVNDLYTERGLFWIGFGFFILAMLTATYILCIGDYAKVLMFREDEHKAFRAFGQAGRLVWQHPRQTFGLYWLMIVVGTVLFGIYFLLDQAILMSGWLTILVMLLIQQALIFSRVFLKVWWLGTAYASYQTLPKPVPVVRQVPAAEPIIEPDNDTPISPVES